MASTCIEKGLSITRVELIRLSLILPPSAFPTHIAVPPDDDETMMSWLSSLCWLSLLVTAPYAVAFSQTECPPVVVIGKIIIDEYGSPEQDRSEADGVSVGGGGPQAAFGAAAALATLSDEKHDPLSSQPVTLIGPVGQDDWTEREESALRATLGGAIRNIHLLPRKSLRTPRIQIWHDSDQNVQWRPLNDSFGPLGAQSLWRVPRANDFLDAVVDASGRVTCHVIIEGGFKSPGDGEDSTFLLDSRVQECIQYLGIEPVVFASDETGKLEETDVASCIRRLERIPSLDFVSPDDLLFQQMGILEGKEMGIRNGPRGSVIIQNDGTSFRVPAATLATNDGVPINPTGAGNAYAAAFTACRGAGASSFDSACIATAVGVVFCEYEHMPPWTASVLERIREAASEVGNKITREVAS